jgi:hypothetical protein
MVAFEAIKPIVIDSPMDDITTVNSCPQQDISHWRHIWFYVPALFFHRLAESILLHLLTIRIGS